MTQETDGLVNDRRHATGSGDFNNPKGTFSLSTPGDDEWARWTGKAPHEVRSDVHAYYSGQKDTATWREATRLAKQRTDHESRKWGHKDGADYANSYEEHLVRVMAIKGPSIAEKNGELHHRQSGYGRV